MVDRTKQSEGPICTGRNLNGFIRTIVVLKVLFLNLIRFQKNATRRAVGERRAEVFSLSLPHVVFSFRGKENASKADI